MTDEDVQQLVEAVKTAQAEWVNGVLNPLWDLREGTIFGPFGGPLAGGPALNQRQAATAARFHDGTSEIEVVNTIVAGDVVCLVLIERNTVRFEGHDEPHSWHLRSTMLFRRDGARWTLLHRHADPLVQVRDFAATLALLAGAP